MLYRQMHGTPLHTIIILRMEPVFLDCEFAYLVIQVSGVPALGHVHIIRDTSQGYVHQVPFQVAHHWEVELLADAFVVQQHVYCEVSGWRNKNV